MRINEILSETHDLNEGWKGAAVGAGLGSALGGPLGAAGGAAVGNWAGDKLSQVGGKLKNAWQGAKQGWSGDSQPPPDAATPATNPPPANAAAPAANTAPAAPDSNSIIDQIAQKETELADLQKQLRLSKKTPPNEPGIGKGTNQVNATSGNKPVVPPAAKSPADIRAGRQAAATNNANAEMGANTAAGKRIPLNPKQIADQAARKAQLQAQRLAGTNVAAAGGGGFRDAKAAAAKAGVKNFESVDFYSGFLGRKL
jgi:hypothetical protein